MKVIGAGFARTGTLSMQSALNTLGFGRTYHMNDVFQNPSHAQLWLDFAESRTADWDALFAGYNACVDFPASCAWKELYDAYPDSKVVLTGAGPGPVVDQRPRCDIPRAPCTRSGSPAPFPLLNAGST